MAGTGDRESPCKRAIERRPLAFPPRPAHLDQVATLLPQGALEDSGYGRAGGLRGLEPLRRETSLLHPGSRQHVTVSSALPVSKRARVCVLAEGGAEQPQSGRAGERARGSGSHNRPSSLRSRRRRGPHLPARFPGPASPCRPRLPSTAPVRAAGRTSPPRTPCSRLPRGGQQARGLRFPPASPPYPASASREKNHLREGRPEPCRGKGGCEYANLGS